MRIVSYYLCQYEITAGYGKKPLVEHIVILVICSLIGIFVYQAYWLTGLYRTMKSEMESNIRDAMRTSDFNEVVLRINDLQKIMWNMVR